MLLIIVGGFQYTYSRATALDLKVVSIIYIGIRGAEALVVYLKHQGLVGI